MGGFSEFYTGSMAPPDKGPNGTLVPSTTFAAPTSLAQIYAGTPYTPAPTAVTAAAPSPYDVANNPFRPGAQAHPAVAAPPQVAQHTVDAANPLDVNRLGLTSDPFHQETPAQTAIETAVLPQRPSSLVDAFKGVGISGHVNGGLQFNGPTNTPTSVPGDPWAGGRITPTAPIPGYGAAPRGLPTPAAPTPSPIAQMYSQPGASYLDAKGVDTSGLSSGQVANEFNKDIRGGGHGSGQWY